MSYTFVLKNGGWWLKISSLEELVDYYKTTKGTNKWWNVIDNYIQGKEFNEYKRKRSLISNTHMPHEKEANLAQAVVYHAANNNQNIIEAIMELSGTIASNQMRDLQERGAIYINRLGGYHGDSTQEKLPFIHRDKLVFPNFQEKEIRVKQFPNGEHWYAYIDDVQVRDGDTLKWNTYKEAYTQAKKYIDG